MKVLVCGPRRWLHQKSIEDALRSFPPGTVLVHGAARGADCIAGFVGEILGFEVREYPVNEALDGPWPAAGVRRNARMLRAEHPSPDGAFIDVGVVCRTSADFTRGTGYMVKLMRGADPPIELREVLKRHRATG